MKILSVLWGLILFWGFTVPAHADIYSWIDADGVRHFSNHAPPKAVEAVEISIETPHVPPSDTEVLKAKQDKIIEEAQEKIAEMEAESMQRLRSAERKIEAAKQEAAEALEEAEEMMKTAEEKSSRAGEPAIYYGYFPYHPRRPFHKKKPVPLPAGVRKDLEHMQYEGRINRPGPKPPDTRKAGYIRQSQANRFQHPRVSPNGSGLPPGLLLQVR